MSQILQRSLKAIEGLKPETVWKIFVELSQIPRPSKKEQKVIEYLRKFCEKNSFNFRTDKIGNVVIDVPASNGYDGVPSVCIQGHIDMVCEKNKDKKHDFDNDPIELVRDNEWIKANGTTLGSDNGIGVCCGLAVATDKNAVHGPLELLCTVDEEMGMSGAMNLKSDFLKSKILLNLDSEERDSFYIGCAGGQETIATYDIAKDSTPASLKPYELMILGLKGGHSGVEIHENRGNSIKLLGRLLHLLITEKVEFKISSVNAGSKLNAIPREAEATIYINPSDESKANAVISRFIEESMNEFKVQDPGLKVSFQPLDSKSSNEQSFTDEFTKKIVKVLLSLPSGVLSMSPSIPDLVETSTNLATIFTKGEKLEIGTSQRSSVNSARYFMVKTVKSILELSGATVEETEPYSGWSPNINSDLLKFSKQVYKNLYNKEPEVKAIHAGLECGILGGIYKDMDMISFGPTIKGAHSPDEKVLIDDVSYTYDVLTNLLEAIAKKHKQ